MTYTPTEQANIDSIYKFMEAEAVQDWDTVYRFIAPDCVSYGPGGAVTRGHEAMHAADAAMFAGLESWRRTILDAVADGETLVFRWRADMVLRPSGKPASLEGVSWTRMRDGQFYETWGYWDTAEVRRQVTTPREAPG